MTRILLMMLAALACSANTQAIEINDIEIDDTLETDHQHLVLNGAGTRSKFFLDVYIAALYLSNNTSDAQEIINADEPMAIRLHIISGLITSERMADSTRDGFVRSMDGNIAPIEGEIEELIKVFRNDIEEDDVFDLVYEPATGVTVYKGGDIEAVVPGLEFKKALFGIWLSDNPVQKSLRKELLNKG